MIKKWKNILLNWINCYFNESDKNEDSVQLESLHIIISHLRESFSLDESKSSILGARTVEEFLLEKYPEFKFDNGTVEARDENEVCIAASLLLFFVCVNSKEVDIKNAMCSRLSREDQEIILKFSKSLMECSSISFKDVQAAITEACGTDVVAESIRSQTVVENTPPVLRSLHSEVRRLQAALDAEQFDRNYLQEELARTNLRVEKLLKDKEQYKLDILDLKAKLSECSKQDEEASNSDTEPNHTAKLLRELQEIESQFIHAQAELNDVISERDIYKSKIEELKKDRDKWLALSQQEAGQVTKLAEELETERHNIISLKELVSELQLHNKLNRVDSSLLECDDPDTSIQSFPHNTSVCSEACTNVIELQLGEERAKIIVLKEQIQTLQDQIKDLNEKYLSDKHTYETILNERETDIFNLKHRINEEIEEKSNLKVYFSNEVTVLNNEVNELEQRLKGNNENSRAIIDRKMQEIKILQEEKLSLLESLSAETTKNENIVKSLKEEIDMERRMKANIKDGYENQIMKLNEKMLNRNNELVELQNNILEKSEIMESLYLDLRKEKELREEISHKFHSNFQQLNEQKIVTEQYLQQRSNEVAELKIITEQKITLINDLQKEISSLKSSLSNTKEKSNDLEETKQKLLIELHNRDIKFKEIQKDIDNVRIIFSEEKEQLTHDLDEKNAMINALKEQLQDEIHYKISCQNELLHLQKINTELSEDLKVAHTEVSVLTAAVQKKEDTIKEMDIYIQKEKESNAKLVADCERLNEYLNNATEDMNQKEIELKLLSDKYENSMKDLQEQLHRKEDIIEIGNEKLKTLMTENQSLQEINNSISNEKLIMKKEIAEKEEKILQLETDREHMLCVVQQDKLGLEEKLMQINKKYRELEKCFDTETSKMIAKLNETEKTIKELSTNSKNTIRNKELKIQKLSLDLDNTTKSVQNLQDIVSRTEREKEALVVKLNEEVYYKNNFEKEYQNQCLLFNQVTVQLNEEVGQKNKELNELKTKLASSVQMTQEKSEEIQILKNQMFCELNASRDLVLQKTIEIKEITNKLIDVESLKSEVEQKLQQEKDRSSQALEVLRKENKHLHSIIEEENSKHEVILIEKDKIIDSIEQKVKNSTIELDYLQKNYEASTLTVEKYTLESQEKQDKIDNLLQEITILKQDHNKIEKAYHEITEQIKKVTKEKEEVELQLKSRMLMLQENLSIVEEKYSNLVKEKDDVMLQYSQEKALRNCLEVEKNNILHENMKIFEDKTQLCNAKALLTQELLEQKSITEILEGHKNRLLEEKISLEAELAKTVKIKNLLEEERDCLTQQVGKDKSAIELIVTEKEDLFKEKVFLAQQLLTVEENSYKVREDLNKLRDEKQMLESEMERLTKEFKKEDIYKDELINEKQRLYSEKESLERDIIEFKAINEAILTDKEVLLLEKEALVKSLGDEKSALDEVENEKNTLKNKIEDISKKHELEIIEKTEELQDKTEEIIRLKMDCEVEKQNNAEISINLNATLDKLIENLKKGDIYNAVLEEMIKDNSLEMTSSEKCDLLMNITDTLTTELSMRRELEKALEDGNTALNELREICKEKEIEICNLQTEIKRFEQIIHEQKLESLKQAETMSTAVNSKVKDIQTLEKENETLTNSLNDVKFQLEIKVHSLKEKLTDNEHLTDKLKRSYECQIDNLNVMISKLSNYLKDKTTELDAMRKENEELKQTIENNREVIKCLEDEIKINKQNQEKLMNDFESERLVLKNMITVTESVMEDQQISLNNIISQHVKTNAMLVQEKESLRETMQKEKDDLILKLKQKNVVLETILNDLSKIKEEKDAIRKDVATQNQNMINEMNLLKDELDLKIIKIQASETQRKDNTELQKYKEDIKILETQNNELKIKIDVIESEKHNRIEGLTRLLDEQTKINKDLEITLKEKMNYCEDIEEKLSDEINILMKEKCNVEMEYKTHLVRLEEDNVTTQKLNLELENLNKDIEKLTKDNAQLYNIIEDNKTELTTLKQQTKDDIEKNAKLCEDIKHEKRILMDKCLILEDYQVKAEKLLEERQKDINLLQQEIETLKTKVGRCEEDLIAKDGFISKISREKDEIINTVKNELLEEKSARERIAASYMAAISARQIIEDNLVLHSAKPETCLLQDQDKKNMKPCSTDDDRLLHQVDNISTDFAHSSTDSLKTISDLEKILDDKNRKITTLQTDITHLRSLLAESESQLIDVRVELDMSKENCQQLSSQLKKIVHQKNEEIAELKRQVNKMSVTENRATQIIKVSAKYQAIILKRIAEIKSNTVLKELTNFGNTNSSDELRRTLPGSVTIEDLENFLETTDRHLKRGTEKQMALQKERDRLSEVNRINESEIINLRKYLTEISLSYQTFSSVKDMYVQKLSRVLSIQRTVRREIFNLDGHIAPASMCKLERSYGAIMQDLSECTMNLERWVERCIAQTVTPEKIKQALLLSSNEPVSLSATSLQNTGLEVQIEELGNSFQRLLEETARASRVESAVDAQAVTVSEVRAEYEDKLNRMKSKMNQLYHEQIGVFKEKQREEITLLKRELQKARDKLVRSSEEYEEHIRKLTVELWRVGEKFVVEKAEADDLRRKTRSGSLMSLQLVHSSGLAPTLERNERPSDTYSLRSLPLDGNVKREGRDLHMSDEDEVFDNRCLKELSATPRRECRESQPPGLRLSELRWRNSLCPPHLKSSYPAETQFVHALDEEDIKFAGAMATGKQQRKEVGITAYKKPGPPTPSKQAGRLSATGSELRESLRVEADPNPSRKTSTPSRLRSFFRSSRNETNEGTPRSRKLSGFFRKM